MLALYYKKSGKKEIPSGIFSKQNMLEMQTGNKNRAKREIFN